MSEDKKRYVVCQGFSLTSKKGIIHAGGVVSADILSIENPEKYLEDLYKKGKVEEIGRKSGYVTSKPTEPESKLEPEPEPKLPETKEDDELELEQEEEKRGPGRPGAQRK